MLAFAEPPWPVLATAPPSSAIGFSAPVVVARGDAGLGGAVAVNGAGVTLVAWRAHGRLWLRRASGETQAVASSVIDAYVALGDDGTAAVVWLRRGAHGSERVQAAVAAPDGRFGTPRTLDASRRRDLPIWGVVAAGGRFAAVWASGVKVPHVRAAIARGRFGAPQTLGSMATRDVVGAGRMSDRVVVAWNGQTGGQTATLAPPSARFGAVHRMHGRVDSPPRVFADATGYQRWSSRAVAMVDSRGGSVGIPRTRALRDDTGPWLAGPVMAWQWTQFRDVRVDDSSDGQIAAGEVSAAIRDAAGRYGKPIRLTAPGEHPSFLRPMTAVAYTPATTITPVPAPTATPAPGFPSPATTPAPTATPPATASAAAAARVSVPPAPPAPAVAVVWVNSQSELRYSLGPAFGAPQTLATHVSGAASIASAGSHVVAVWSSGGKAWMAQLG